jgi:hypothetical protein
MDSDVYKMCPIVYNMDRWILFWKYIHGVKQKGLL